MHTRSRSAAAFQREVEARGLTHEQVELALGLATLSGQITRLMSGERKPGRKLSFRIHEEFGVDMDVAGQAMTIFRPMRQEVRPDEIAGRIEAGDVV